MDAALELRLDEVLLSRRQLEVLSFYAFEIDFTGVAPTLRQAAHHIGVCIATVRNALVVLRERGFVEFEYRCPRTARLTDKARAIQVVGTVDKRGSVKKSLLIRSRDQTCHASTE
jgi:hypothetical protein